MNTAEELAPPQVRWDLSALFSGLDDPAIERTWKGARARAEAFESAYRGKIDSPDLDAKTLAEAMREIEALAQEAGKPLTYSHLLYEADSSDPKLGAFFQKQMEKSTELSVLLMFFELELQAAPEATIRRILPDPLLDNYRHAIEVRRLYSPHRLTEAEEILLEETANTGIRAWQRLFQEVTANHVYRLKRPGSDEVEELNQSEVIALLRDPSRDVRAAAAAAFTTGLKEMERVLVFIFNNLLQDKALDDRLRNHPYPEHSRHLSNELDRETVDLVVRLCKDHYGLVARFYSLKREILGLSELTHIDRYAPLFEAKEKVSWERAREIVVESFHGFHPELGERGQEFFDKNWIDAEPRPGKGGGAFCSYNTPDTHPVLLQSYLNKMDDVMTLAHELGHGVHASFSREQSYFNFHGTLPLAELASTFGEMLVFERVAAEASPKDKLALYAEKIEGIFATIFRQAAMFHFEQRIHAKRREEGELTTEEFGEVWQEELQQMFGASILLGDEHRLWWSYVSHFVSAPFYVYAYSFGELLVLSLYEMAKQGGPEFRDRYIQLLRLGGSQSPAELMAFVGVDLRSEAFWKGGFEVLERLLGEFEDLWKEYAPQGA
jgi:oligoendopeptidase F